MRVMFDEARSKGSKGRKIGDGDEEETAKKGGRKPERGVVR